jgi:AcrR family transcriptional regulator
VPPRSTPHQRLPKPRNRRDPQGSASPSDVPGPPVSANPADVQGPSAPEDAPPRARILDAAFAAFTDGGFAETSTLEIATRARVSKRELYTLVGNKQAMLLACIAERAQRLPLSGDLTPASDRETLAHELATFGARLLREVTDPTVIAAFRLAIAEAERTPEVAQTLNALGRDKARAALTEVMAQASSAGLVAGPPTDLAEQFMALLWGDLLVRLLLRVADPPTPAEAELRARSAATALLQLHPSPDDAASDRPGARTDDA